MKARGAAANGKLGTPRALARLFLVCTLIGSGGYVMLYLSRWEWNRALISGLFFLAAEIALVADLLAGRLRRMEGEMASIAGRLERDRRPAPPPADADSASPAALTLAATRPAAPDYFAWLRPDGHMNVFVPMLMGAGVVLSALAWLVERLARVTVGPALEHRLAARLGPLMPPAFEGGLVPVPHPAFRPRSQDAHDP